MKKNIIYTICIFSYIIILSITGYGEYRQDIFEKVKLTQNDIPAGFVYGKIPKAFRSIFKLNPGVMDSSLYYKVAKNLYPGGDSKAIERIHVSIIADERTPFRDDIVCWVILFKNNTAAEKEMPKINEFAQYNGDRIIVVSKQNLAVFLLVDNTENLHYIRKMADTIEERLDNLSSSAQISAVK